MHVNGVVTLVDGEALAAGSPVADAEALERQRAEDPSLDHLTAIDDLFEDQLQAADLVLISRADCLDAPAMAEVQGRIKDRVRPGTALLPVSQGQVETSVVLGLEHKPTPLEAHHDHDHSHVDMVGSNVRVEGAFDRQALEQLLPSLVSNLQVVRLKGRVWLPSKTLPLQIQMVGPRLNSWFEAAPSHAWRPDQGFGADLVVLALNEAAAPALESGLQRLVQATPAKASPAAATPES